MRFERENRTDMELHSQGGSTMRRTCILAALLLAGPAGAAEKAEKLGSGLAKGQGVPPFDVVDVTGPNAPNKLCYI
jgi:hypothetical protein